MTWAVRGPVSRSSTWAAPQPRPSARTARTADSRRAISCSPGSAAGDVVADLDEDRQRADVLGDGDDGVGAEHLDGVLRSGQVLLDQDPARCGDAPFVDCGGQQRPGVLGDLVEVRAEPYAQTSRALHRFDHHGQADGAGRGECVGDFGDDGEVRRSDARVGEHPALFGLVAAGAYGLGRRAGQAEPVGQCGGGRHVVLGAGQDARDGGLVLQRTDGRPQRGLVGGVHDDRPQPVLGGVRVAVRVRAQQHRHHTEFGRARGEQPSRTGGVALHQEQQALAHEPTTGITTSSKPRRAHSSRDQAAGASSGCSTVSGPSAAGAGTIPCSLSQLSL